MAKPVVALFLHQPKCSIQSGNGIIYALQDNFNFKIFTKQSVESGFFNDVDIVAFPGGIGDADSWDYLLKPNLEPIKEYMDNGGRYLGICMGAYWAGSDYFNLLKDVEVGQYIKRPDTDTRRPHPKEMPIVWKGRDESMFFYDGCAFGGGQYEIIAKYMNEDPMAIIQGKIGLIGCHPEANQHWYDSYSWMKKRWNGNKHHLLTEFVDDLMER